MQPITDEELCRLVSLRYEWAKTHRVEFLAEGKPDLITYWVEADHAPTAATYAREYAIRIAGLTPISRMIVHGAE